MSPDVLGQLLPVVVVVLLLYVLVIRPARKRAQKVTTLQAALSPGDEVMLTSGIFATIDSVTDDRLTVSVADGVLLTVHRGAVAEIVRDVPAPDAHDTGPDTGETADPDVEVDGGGQDTSPPPPRGAN